MSHSGDRAGPFDDPRIPGKHPAVPRVGFAWLLDLGGGSGEYSVTVWLGNRFLQEVYRFTATAQNNCAEVRMGRMLCVVLVLLSAAVLPAGLQAQQGGSIGEEEARESVFELGTNYPNPFNPETRIPFELHDDAFVDGRPAIVTARIYNALVRYVASPTALNHPAGEGTPVIDLEYQFPGRHELYWDGRDRSGSPVASGIYVLEMTVNGKSRMMRMYVSK